MMDAVPLYLSRLQFGSCVVHSHDFQIASLILILLDPGLIEVGFRLFMMIVLHWSENDD